MTFDYTDPTSEDKDAVRFLIGDTTDEGHLIEDEEIEYLLGKYMPVYSTVEYTASVAADSIAARFAREASYSADGVSVSLANLGQQFRDLAANLRLQHKNLLVGGEPDVGGITPGEQPDPDIKPLNFGKGMHDNPEAGRQDYGQAADYYLTGYYNVYDMPGA